MTAHDDLATLRKGIGCIGHAFKWVYEGEVATSQCDRGECHRCRFEEALSRLEAELARLEGARLELQDEMARLMEPARSLWALAEAMDKLPAPREWANLREPLWDAVQDVASAYEKARNLLADKETTPT